MQTTRGVTAAAILSVKAVRAVLVLADPHVIGGGGRERVRWTGGQGGVAHTGGCGRRADPR